MEISRLFLTATGLLPVVFLVSVIALRLAQGADKPRAVMEGFLARLLYRRPCNAGNEGG
jgi:hypothetical protein